MTTTLQISRYEVIETLGTGASSRVDRARDSVIGRTVALKTFVTGFGQDGEQQFLREAQIVGQLSDPSIVQLYDVGTDDHGTAYLVMEYVAGNTLAHYLTQSAVPLPRACAWAADLSNALAKAHCAGIIHGDVKPANIFVTAENKVKLGDFGIARFATQISGSGRVMGTPAYLSPEQIKGEKQDQRSDIFSLGVVLYEMVTGIRPFAGTSLPAVCAQILEANPIPPSKCNSAFPQIFDRIIARCLAKDPRDRYQSGEEMARDLYVLARAKKQAGPVRPQSNWFAQPLRSRDLWAVTAMSLVVATGATITHAFRNRSGIAPLPVFVARAPRVPSDLLIYSQRENGSLQDAAPSVTAIALSKKTAHLSAHVPVKNSKSTAAAATTVREQISASAPPIPVTAIPAPAVLTVEHAGLQIDITSTTTDGTLAVFADQSLLFTTELHGGSAAEPVHLDRSLPAGPHQLRVALYRPDKSLLVQKEGLTDLRTESLNTLGIRVTRHKKLLIHREDTLEVSWPRSNVAPATPAAAAQNATGSLSARSNSFR
jgi:serine/threonine protein kinase